MPNICHELLIGAPVERVYNAITSQAGLSAWWTPGTSANPQIYSVARFAFGPRYFKEMKIEELTPPVKVKWTCIAGADEWIGTTISFELEAGDKDTYLHLHPELKDQLEQQENATPT